MSEHKHTNRLSKESSPYLLQHAHNPVDWYAWGEEAIAKARTEDKPILLSIGYSACHWCHVMERESFESEEIASLMNEMFVNIKVDREERPDIDQIYMNAVQLMQRQGGWPLTVFLTPELVPFYGGTYFPPEDRYNIPGFPRILQLVSNAYRTRKTEIDAGATEMLAELRRMSAVSESNEVITPAILDDGERALLRTFDSRNGGFGGAPKFPAPMSLEFLLRAYKRTANEQALAAAAFTCRKMAEGGLYDHLGGGFHRYSTDARWLVPHFEKMLYDNAQLSRLYVYLFQITGDEFYRRVAEETYDYVLREMTDESGGFYSTQDADSEGVEGKFFVWDKSEIIRLLGETDGALFCAYYNVTEEGNFEEKNILNITRTLESVAQQTDVSIEDLRERLARGRRLLFEEREKRVKPGRDEKVISAWNGLMLESIALAAAVFERDDYLQAAERNARFLLEQMTEGRLLLHVFKDGKSKQTAFLDDYACVISGLIALYESTGTTLWLERATMLADVMIEEFWDEADGGFFYTGQSSERLIVRNKDFFDNATPSGNSVAADVLLKLSVLTGEEKYRRLVTTIFRLMRDTVVRYPSAFGRTLSALDFFLSTPKEIVIIGADEQLQSFVRAVWKHYLPNKVLVQSRSDDAATEHLLPLLQGRSAKDGRTTAYVCENYTCRQPVTTVEELAEQMLN